MGGHNVLGTPDGLIAVRNDHMRIAPAADDESGLAALITDVEYQGTYVLLGLQLEGAAPGKGGVSVLLSESQFVARPYAVGERVRLSWTDDDARVLGPGVAPAQSHAASAPPDASSTGRDDVEATALPAVAF